MAAPQSPPTGTRCCVCGGPLVEERRQPGRAGTLTRFVKERRDLGTPPAGRSLLL
jgi:hypothetical protein